jgi:hypothetical protein
LLDAFKPDFYLKTEQWLAPIIYNEEDQGQISIRTFDIADNVIELSCAPLQLLKANTMIIPTISPYPLPSVSLPTPLFTNQYITEHYII